MTERNDDAVHSDPRIWVGRLTGLLDQQHEQYALLESLSGRQSELIQSNQTDALLSVLAERQAVIDRIADIGERLDPFRQRWTELMGQVSETTRQTIRDRVDALAELIERIAERDERDRADLEQQRTMVSRELAGLRKGRGAMVAYSGKPARSAPMFQDREG